MFGTPATGETRSGRFVLPVEFPIESVDLFLPPNKRLLSFHSLKSCIDSEIMLYIKVIYQGDRLR